MQPTAMYSALGCSSSHVLRQGRKTHAIHAKTTWCACTAAMQRGSDIVSDFSAGAALLCVLAGGHGAQHSCQITGLVQSS